MSRLFNASSSDFLRDDAAPLTAEPLTLACWFRTNSIAVATGQMVWIGNTATTTDFFGLARRTDTVRLSIASTISGAVSVQGSGETSVGPWFHACGTVSGTTRLCYINGVLVATGGVTANVPVGLNRIALGRLDGLTSSGYFGGNLAEVGIWNDDLTPEAVVALARGVSPQAGGIIPAPIRYYRLKNDGDFSDASGNGGVLTNAGTIWSPDHPAVMDEYGRFANPGRPLAVA